MGFRVPSAASFAALFIIFGATHVLGDDVKLTARDGTLSLSGVMRGYDGEMYRIDTVYGVLTVDARGVICDGPGCPNLIDFVPEVRVIGEGDLAQAVFAALIADFAVASDQQLSWVQALGREVEVTLGPPDQPGARFSFIPVQPGQAAAALRDAEAEFAIVAGDLAVETGRDSEQYSRLIALDPLVPVAAPGNPVGSIGLRDLRAVMAGAITTWADIGGPDMPFALHGLTDDSAVQQVLDARLGPPRIPVRRHSDATALADAMRRDPWALAVVPSSLRGAARALSLRDSCGHFLIADRFAVKSEDYQMALALHLLSARRHLAPVARAFRDHVATPSAQAAIAATGLVDIAPETQSAAVQGGRLVNAIRAAGPEVSLADLQRLVGFMAEMDRLSLTFRFEGGARQLDAASRSHLSDLARLLEAGVFDGMELVFAGFSDGDGDASANLALSRARSEAVMQAIVAAAPLMRRERVRLGTEAFGESLPIACDDTATGRQTNRRVETWLRAIP